MPDTRTAWYVCLSTACGAGTLPVVKCMHVGCARAPSRTVACARTAQPRDPPPHPSGCALWSTQPERARLCMHHACVLHARQCEAAQPAGNEEAHAFARLSRGCKLCALCSRNAGTRRIRTVGVGVGRVSHARTSASSQSKCQGPNGAKRFGSRVFLFRLPPRSPPRRKRSGAW